MEPRGTTTHKPLIMTVHTPVDIVGRSNMEIFTRHMRICFNENTGEFPEKKLKREFSPQERAAIAETLRELSANGFNVDGINSRGGIRWTIDTRKREYDMFEDGLQELQGMTMEELAEHARSGYRRLRDTKDVPDVDEYERQREEEFVY